MPSSPGQILASGCLGAALVCAVVASRGVTQDAKQTQAPGIDFARDVRPILEARCFACHGPDRNKRQAGLRLDVREEAVGHQAIVPGKPQESKLMVRVLSADVDMQMPPASTHKQLTAAQKETLRRWIAGGAVYQPHWAYIAPQRPAVPKHARPPERPSRPG